MARRCGSGGDHGAGDRTRRGRGAADRIAGRSAARLCRATDAPQAQAAPALRHGQHRHRDRVHRRAGRLRRHQAGDRRRHATGDERRDRLRRGPAGAGGAARRIAGGGDRTGDRRAADLDAGCHHDGADDACERRPHRPGLGRILTVHTPRAGIVWLRRGRGERARDRRRPADRARRRHGARRLGEA